MTSVNTCNMFAIYVIVIATQSHETNHARNPAPIPLSKGQNGINMQELCGSKCINMQFLAKRPLTR